MPDQGRPRVVQHPLNHARGSVFVPRIGFEHGALAVVGHCLRLALIIIERRCLSVATVQTIGKNIDRREAFAARVIIPNVIDRPEVILGDESLQRIPRGDRRPRTCLRVVAVGAARLRIGQPVHRRHILVGAGHFYARFSRDRRLLFRSGRNHRIWPLQLFLDVQIHFFDVCRRGIVTAVQPDKDARMISQPGDLVPQRSRRNFVLIPLPVTPFLPGIAACPPRHDQNPQPVRLFEEFVAVKPPFQADGVHAHIAHVCQIRVQPRRRPAEKKIGRPSRSTDQHFSPVDLEQQVLLLRQFRGNLANSKRHVRRV